MQTFHESLRHKYELSPDSLVVEIGCHTGGFAKTMAEKYRCRVLTFEPIKRFYDEAVVNFLLSTASDLIRAENVGIGATTRKETFGIHGEKSGIVAGGEQEVVQLVAIEEALDHDWAKGRIIDVLSINCEMGEYELLEAMLDLGLMARVNNLQVQFHSMPRCEERRAAIRNRLLITHRPSWEYGAFDNGWDGFEIK